MTALPNEKPLNRIQTLVDWRVFYSNTGGALRLMREILPRMAEKYGVSVGYLCRARKNVPPAVSHSFDASLPFPFSLLPEIPFKEARWTQRLTGMENTVFHTPYYTLCPAPLPTVATIYDLISEIFPEQSPGPHFDKVRQKKAELIRGATRLIAISKSTTNDLCRRFNVSPDRVDHIPLAVDFTFFSTAPSPSEVGRFRSSLPPRPFLLIVGGRENHKNFARFLEAYRGSPLKDDFHVVVTGEGWAPDEQRLLEDSGVKPRIYNVGKIDDHGLRTLYHLAAALVYPSYYEGFGLPALEAMASGTPLAVSHASSLPEVVGDAGYYFDPHDATEMAAQIRLAADGGRGAKKVQVGQTRARQFTWDETARLTALTYQRALAR